jgi:nicotinamidase-related amidase
MNGSTALLVIDVQCAMFDTYGPPYQGEQVVERICGLIARARQAGAPVMFVQHCTETGAFQPGTPGWWIHPALAPRDGEVVIQKRTPNCFKDTTLDKEMERAGVRTLVIAGMQTEFCVDTTCRAAFDRGYGVILAEDAHTTFDTSTLSALQIISHHNEILGECFAVRMPASCVDFCCV